MGTHHINITADQARPINAYKNTRTKLMQCCANVYFNKQCLKYKVTPKYPPTCSNGKILLCWWKNAGHTNQTSFPVKNKCSYTVSEHDNQVAIL
jgi:hypothetical protein